MPIQTENITQFSVLKMRNSICFHVTNSNLSKILSMPSVAQPSHYTLTELFAQYNQKRIAHENSNTFVCPFSNKQRLNYLEAWSPKMQCTQVIQRTKFHRVYAYIPIVLGLKMYMREKEFRLYACILCDASVCICGWCENEIENSFNTKMSDNAASMQLSFVSRR